MTISKPPPVPATEEGDAMKEGLQGAAAGVDRHWASAGMRVADNRAGNGGVVVGCTAELAADCIDGGDNLGGTGDSKVNNTVDSVARENNMNDNSGGGDNESQDAAVCQGDELICYSKSLLSYYSLHAPDKFSSEFSSLLPSDPRSSLGLEEYSTARCREIVGRYCTEEGGNRIGALERDLESIYKKACRLREGGGGKGQDRKEESGGQTHKQQYQRRSSIQGESFSPSKRAPRSTYNPDDTNEYLKELLSSTLKSVGGDLKKNLNRRDLNAAIPGPSSEASPDLLRARRELREWKMMAGWYREVLEGWRGGRGEGQGIGCRGWDKYESEEKVKEMENETKMEKAVDTKKDIEILKCEEKEEDKEDKGEDKEGKETETEKEKGDDGVEVKGGAKEKRNVPADPCISNAPDDELVEHFKALAGQQAEAVGQARSECERLRGLLRASREEASQLRSRLKVEDKMKERVKEMKEAVSFWERKGTQWDTTRSGMEKEIERLRDRVVFVTAANTDLQELVEMGKVGKERMEVRWEEERRILFEAVKSEEERVIAKVKEDRDKFREEFIEEVEGGIESFLAFQRELREDEKAEMVIRIAEGRQREGELRDENEHLKREMRRAAEKIVDLVRDREERSIKDVSFRG